MFLCRLSINNVSFHCKSYRINLQLILLTRTLLFVYSAYVSNGPGTIASFLNWAPFKVTLTVCHFHFIREIKHRVFFSRERQRGSRDLNWTVVAGRRFYSRRTFFPFGGNAKTEYLQPIFTVYLSILIACFYSYASFIILLLHKLLVKLKEFQIQAENT